MRRKGILINIATVISMAHDHVYSRIQTILDNTYASCSMPGSRPASLTD